MAIDLNFLSKAFFYFDEPVRYKLDKDSELLIHPINLKSSEIFLSSCSILNIDKNSCPDPKIIQMSYLQFLAEIILGKEYENLKASKQQLLNILILCLNLKSPKILWDDFHRPYIYDSISNIKINSKQFEDIRKIILYQNILHYDDSYINPDFKKAMDEQDELKNRNLEPISMERKIAIITAHSGLPKREQLLMTYRSHCLLFEEICGEVEFTTTRPAILATGNKEQDHWIYKKRRDKFDGYTKTVDSYTNSFGGSQSIKSVETNNSNNYVQQFNNFSK